MKVPPVEAIPDREEMPDVAVDSGGLARPGEMVPQPGPSHGEEGTIAAAQEPLDIAAALLAARPDPAPGAPPSWTPSPTLPVSGHRMPAQRALAPAASPVARAPKASAAAVSRVAQVTGGAVASEARLQAEVEGMAPAHPAPRAMLVAASNPPPTPTFKPLHVVAALDDIDAPEASPPAALPIRRPAVAPLPAFKPAPADPLVAGRSDDRDSDLPRPLRKLWSELKRLFASAGAPAIRLASDDSGDDGSLGSPGAAGSGRDGGGAEDGVGGGGTGGSGSPGGGSRGDAGLGDPGSATGDRSDGGGGSSTGGGSSGGSGSFGGGGNGGRDSSPGSDRGGGDRGGKSGGGKGGSDRGDDRGRDRGDDGRGDRGGGGKGDRGGGGKGGNDRGGRGGDDGRDGRGGDDDDD